MTVDRVKILITGVNGFIGRNLVHGLNVENIEIIGVSMEETSPLSKVNIYEQADISDFDRMEAIFEKHRPDCVIHLAAIVHKKSFTADYDAFYKVNYLSSENIFKLCIRYNVKKLLFSSTVEVYDMIAGGILNETSATLPSSDYGKTKLLAEQSLMDTAKDTSLNYAVMRFAPVYGSDFTLNLDKRIYLMREKILYYFRNGDYFFNMCSIFNIIDFISAFIRENHDSGIYNISDSINYRIKEIANAEKNFKKPILLRFPYHLTYIAIAISERMFKMIKRRSVISVYNFRKIFKCIIFDSKKASDILDGFKWDIMSTLYNGGGGHKKIT